MSYSLNWNLDSIFSGGSHSDALNQRMKQLEDQMNEYYHRVTKWSPSSDNAEQLNAILQLQETITNGFTQCSSYITALLSAMSMIQMQRSYQASFTQCCLVCNQPKLYCQRNLQKYLTMIGIRCFLNLRLKQLLFV